MIFVSYQDFAIPIPLEPSQHLIKRMMKYQDHEKLAKRFFLVVSGALEHLTREMKKGNTKHTL